MTRVADLAGAELALWVARALGWKQQVLPITKSQAWFDDRGRFTECVAAFMPHEDWYQGGQLIEAHHITIDWNTCNDEDPTYDAEPWMSVISGGIIYYGPTPLIAAMRALVASVYGDEVAS